MLEISLVKQIGPTVYGYLVIRTWVDAGCWTGPKATYPKWHANTDANKVFDTQRYSKLAYTVQRYLTYFPKK